MKNKNLEDTLFTACATCTMLAVGTALTVLLYEVVTLSVSLAESAMFAANPWLRGF
jgi:hypothetical protein